MEPGQSNEIKAVHRRYSPPEAGMASAIEGRKVDPAVVRAETYRPDDGGDARRVQVQFDRIVGGFPHFTEGRLHRRIDAVFRDIAVDAELRYRNPCAASGSPARDSQSRWIPRKRQCETSPGLFLPVRPSHPRIPSLRNPRKNYLSRGPVVVLLARYEPHYRSKKALDRERSRAGFRILRIPGFRYLFGNPGTAYQIEKTTVIAH